MAYEIITLVILILLSGFFSGIEVAFVSLSKSKVRYLKEQNTPGIKYVEELKAKPQRLIITILIGNNIVNIYASALATVVAITFLEGYQIPFANPIGIATGVMTLLILTFGEIIPKVYAQMHAVKVALATGRIIWFLEKLLFPIVIVFEKMTQLATRMAGGQHQHEKLSEDEIKSIVHFGHKQGAIEHIEKELIHNVLDFDEKVVRQVMTPKNKIVGLQSDMKCRDALQVFIKSGYNRLVVLDKRKVVGLVSIWKIIKETQSPKGGDKKVKTIMRSPIYVDQNLHLDELFGELKKRKHHMALVLDSRKRLVGLITDQDLLDEFLGRDFETPHHM